jgi:hypothetical protein
MKVTKYPKIKELPPGSMTVRLYAASVGVAHAYVYVKYDRLIKKAKDTNSEIDTAYRIYNYQGINFVVPQTVPA